MPERVRLLCSCQGVREHGLSPRVVPVFYHAASGVVNDSHGGEGEARAVGECARQVKPCSAASVSKHAGNEPARWFLVEYGARYGASLKGSDMQFPNYVNSASKIIAQAACIRSTISDILPMACFVP